MDIKSKIKRILWEKDYTRTISNEISNFLIAPPYYNEYMDIKIKEIKPNYLNAISKLFTSMLINKFMDECIDMVIEVHEELNAYGQVKKE